MPTDIFISYRRDDCSAEAGRIEDALAQELSHEKLFLDTSSIQCGEEWPQRIEEALSTAKVLVAVIGIGWLKSTDEWGRRRIDLDDDWVRKELEFAIAKKIRILPVLVAGAILPPRPELLPKSISTLLNTQAVDIRPQYWNHDILLLIERVKGIINSEKKKSRYYPGKPSVDYPDPIEGEKLQTILNKLLCDWVVVKSPLPDDGSVTREELFKTYEFKNFKEAMDFMTQVAQGCEMHGHHPRWENLWNKIHVYLTTWGVGFRITDRDIRLAQYLDKSYKKYPGTVSKK